MITNFDTTGFESSGKEKKNKPGKIVNEFIKNASRDLGEYKSNIAEPVSNVDEVGE